MAQSPNLIQQALNNIANEANKRFLQPVEQAGAYVGQQLRQGFNQLPNALQQAQRSIQQAPTQLQQAARPYEQPAINLANNIGRTIGNQRILNAPIQTPTLVQASNLLLRPPSGGTSPITSFLQGNVQAIPGEFAQGDAYKTKMSQLMAKKNKTPEEQRLAGDYLLASVPIGGIQTASKSVGAALLPLIMKKAQLSGFKSLTTAEKSILKSTKMTDITTNRVGASMGDFQEASQQKRGLPLLANLDQAMRVKNYPIARRIAQQILTDPKYKDYQSGALTHLGLIDKAMGETDNLQPARDLAKRLSLPEFTQRLQQTYGATGPEVAAAAPIKSKILNEIGAEKFWREANGKEPKIAFKDLGLRSPSYFPKNLQDAQQGFINFNAKVGSNRLKVKNAAQQIDQELNNGVPPQAPDDPVQKVIAALGQAKPIRAEQNRLYSQERGKRVARLVAMGNKVSGEKGYFAQLGQLKGQLPKADFEGIRKAITQDDVDSLFNKVEQSPLSPFEKVTAKTGLAKLMGAQGGTVPTRGELQLLNEIFPKEFTQAVLSKRPFLQKLWSRTENALNLPRAILATADLSAPLRQGAFLVGRPKQFVPAFGQMFKYAFKESAYQDLQAQIRSRPTYQAMRQSGLAITDMKPALEGREEAFMSNYAEKIPWFGHIARGSNRAYSGFLNKLRADTFDDLLSKAKAQGIIEKNPQVADSIAKFVNSATGRGDLGALNKAAVVLNSVFFSPRLMASRLNLLNPVYYTKLDPFVRREALKSLFTFAGTAATVLGLAKLGGADVGTDPRSTDFGKIKVGDTRFDPWGGFQQYIVGAARLMSGQMVSSTTGKEFNLGEGYKPTSRQDILLRLFQSKEAPVLSFITDLLKGQTATGEQVNVPVAVVDRFIPLLLQDLHDLVKENGLEGVGMTLPAVFGIGVQTYGDQIPQVTQTPTGRKTISYRQAPSLGEDLINKVTGTQVSNVPSELQQPIAKAHLQDLKNQAEVDKVKQIVLQTGEPQKVGETWVYLDNGVVTTKSPPGSSTKLLNMIPGQTTKPTQQYRSYIDPKTGEPKFVLKNKTTPTTTKTKKLKSGSSTVKKLKAKKAKKLPKLKRIKFKVPKLKKIKLSSSKS